MELRVIQWNIKINCQIDKILEYLKIFIKPNTVINLQEVSKNASIKISEESKTNMEFSLDYREPGLYEGRNRKMGVMTIVYGGTINKTALLDMTVFPERSLATTIDFKEVTIENLTFHSLTGVDYKKAKSSNFASIASYLDKSKVDLLTCDANEPKIDSFDENLIECFDNKDKGKNASYLFGMNRMHQLIDSYKFYADKTNVKLESGYTHITGGNRKRYDFIYGNPKWEILKSETNYEESLNATSDHAILVTDYLIK